MAPKNTIDELKTLIKLLEKSSLQELEIEQEGGHRIRLSKGAVAQTVVSAPVAAAPVAPAAHVAAPAASEKPAPAAAETDQGHKVVSPMIGTVYMRPSPEDDAFVSVGDSVKEGDVICLVEAMKVFSKIKADKSGVVKQIKVEDGQAVEFGQVLITIEG